MTTLPIGSNNNYRNNQQMVYTNFSAFFPLMIPNYADHDFPVPGYLIIPSGYMRLVPNVCLDRHNAPCRLSMCMCISYSIFVQPVLMVSVQKIFVSECSSCLDRH